MALSLKEQYDKYAKQMMQMHATNALMDTEMWHIDPNFARFASDLEEAAKNHPEISLRLAVTKVERMLGWRAKRPDAFDP
jgi:hypothetical protein